MAVDTLSASGAWRKLSNAGKPATPTPMVSLRNSDYLALNAHFLRLANATSATHVTVYVSSDGTRLGIRFHKTDPDDGALKLTQDGGRLGQRPFATRVLRIKSVVDQCPRLAALMREHASLRKWRPELDTSTGLWTVPIVPCFENKYGLLRPKENESGIYRYRLGQDTVYIGRGNFRERFAMPDRKYWHFDSLEFSILNEEDSERYWESIWIALYRRLNGRLPIYNRIAGVATSLGDAEWIEQKQSSS